VLGSFFVKAAMNAHQALLRKTVASIMERPEKSTFINDASLQESLIVDDADSEFQCYSILAATLLHPSSCLMEADACLPRLASWNGV
jgi:hypothetical protein